MENENKKRTAENESGGLRKSKLQPYIIVMPKGGHDLAIVALKERLNLRDIHGIMGQVAKALAYLHSRGIAHADIKLLVCMYEWFVRTIKSRFTLCAEPAPLRLRLALATD